MLIKTRSCRSTGRQKEKKIKDAEDFFRLAKELKGPLLFEGYSEERAKSLKDEVKEGLAEIARLRGMKAAEFVDMLEL